MIKINMITLTKLNLTISINSFDYNNLFFEEFYE